MIFIEIKNYEGLYSVNNQGIVKSIKKDKVLNQETSWCGYKRVKLSKNNVTKFQSVHRLVATAFISNPDNYAQVNHIDGDKSNNVLGNLEWCNNSQNHKHAFIKKLRVPMGGINNPRSKLNESNVEEIKSLYKTNNYSQRELAVLFNVSQTTINNIINNLSWKKLID